MRSTSMVIAGVEADFAYLDSGARCSKTLPIAATIGASEKHEQVVKIVNDAAPETLVPMGDRNLQPCDRLLRRLKKCRIAQL